MSSGTSVETESAEHTRSELEAVQREIEELKRALVDADVRVPGKEAQVS